MDPLREVRNRLLNGWQLSKLYTFEVAARHQSFALAADELSLSPSAVSHRINQLEDELGINYLFVLIAKWNSPTRASGYFGR